ncbi:DUF1513 domain-containing protein [Ciceribacter ferrooxidans]|uniref:DUF1513 domain-containing protein n=1 Tax=Ciceribacter ferrooxidans TaxID=2509717 RepID=A0A4Q2SZQ1_9HYPH|nr:DUF1513 domain-containing protein [Ciceribacter ferrooxidans]RYC09848.1 DUF1513 domain-containing protein [Ciceribacter ferrooxidans]
MRRSVLIDRRSFVKAAGAAFLAGLSSEAAFALDRADAVFASGFRAPSGAYGLALLSEEGEIIAQVDLPGRMHGLTSCTATGKVVAFARRPGTFAIAVDPGAGSEPTVFACGENRHFFGHGSFSPDGHLLYACENDFDNNRGVIGIYDAASGFSRLGEVPAHGVGTHDMTVSDDGRLLIIANGGIETHPDFGRTKLNLDHMEPSLVISDARTGALIEKHTLPPALRQLSTRHLALADNGRIWFACQYEGPRNDLPPLVGYFGRGEELRLVDLPEETTEGLANYVGAIAVNRHNNLVGLTSPKGGLTVTLDGATGARLRQTRIVDAAAIAPGAEGFAVSSYDGRFGRTQSAVAWDQHIVRLGTL